MEISVDTSPAQSLSVDALALLAWEAPPAAPSDLDREQPPAPVVDPAIAQQSGWLAEMRTSGEFTGKLYETVILYRPADLRAKRLVVIGGGKQDKFNPAEARRVAGALVRHLKPKGIQSVALILPESASPAMAQAALEGALLGAWEPDALKTDAKKNEKSISSFVINVAKAGSGSDWSSAEERARAIAGSQNLARDLINTPGNRLTPAQLAEAAREVAAEANLEFELLDRARMVELGMGALLGVAQGSDQPPYLIVLRYNPARVFGSDQLALVGKGVTFDTGGISIKPAEHMEKMKYDMAGAAAVLGAMRAIATLRPAVSVSAYIPTVENMVSGGAQRPGDIVTTMSGKTVEVLNTDAEGRLILADAITYARKQGATHLADAATLTGAIGIALGHHNIGGFTNNEALWQRVAQAATEAGEKLWQLPMDEEYKDYLKSVFADLPNIGGRYGGSITAAWFLREFADPTPWVHLDIASTAWLDDGRPWLAKGPSGVAVRLFTQLALDWNSSQ